MIKAITKTRNRTPKRVTNSAIGLYPKKYKIPAKTNIKMANKTSFKNFLIYISLALTITIIVYYVPNYYFLESVTASHCSIILTSLGLEAPVQFFEGFVTVGNYIMARECTGIQVIAVFLGLILPLPKVSYQKKILSLSLIGGLLYLANLFRVILEFYLVESNILPWSLAHYPLSLGLGIFGVFFLVVINYKIIPEFGEYVFSLTKSFQDLLWHKQSNT